MRSNMLRPKVLRASVFSSASLTVVLAAVVTGCNGGDRANGVVPGIVEKAVRQDDAGRFGEFTTRESKYESGELSQRIEGYVDEDGEFVPHGTLTNFWQEGQRKSELHFVHGLRHGARNAWYQSGHVWSEGRYVDGKEDGTWTTWYPSGRRAQEINFLNGAFHGQYTEWHLNGNMKTQFTYINGMKQGQMHVWNEHGNLVKEVEYHDDVEQP